MSILCTWGLIAVAGIAMLGTEAPYTLCIVVPCSLIMCCIAEIYRLLIRDMRDLWTPTPWFLTTTAVYYGVGPLAYVWATPQTVAYMNAFYPVDIPGLVNAHMITAVGILLASGSYTILMRTIGLECVSANHHNIPKLRACALRCVIIGTPFYLIFVVPRTVGLDASRGTGALELLGSLAPFSMAMLWTLTRLAPTPWGRFGFALMLAMCAGSALMTLSKMAIMKLCILLAMADSLAHATSRRIGLAAGLMIMAYVFVLSPLVTFGRESIRMGGLQSMTEVEMLAQDVMSGRMRAHFDSTLPGVQGWWSRLCYANAQLYTIDAFDRGNSGDSLSLLPWVLAPRLLFPDKPEMTSGMTFSLLVKGRDDGYTAPGFWGEAYWNGGFLALSLVGCAMGVMMYLWALYTRRAIVRQQYHMLSVSYIGLGIGLQQDSWIVPTMFGVLPLAAALHLFMAVLMNLRLKLPIHNESSPAVRR